MQNEILSGNWKQLKGKITEQWGKLTDTDLDEISGKAQNLIGALERKYGYTKEQAERELENFVNRTSQKTQEMQQTAGRLIAEHPFAALGVGIVTGMAIAMLLRR